MDFNGETVFYWYQLPHSFYFHFSSSTQLKIEPCWNCALKAQMAAVEEEEEEEEVVCVLPALNHMEKPDWAYETD